MMENYLKYFLKNIQTIFIAFSLFILSCKSQLSEPLPILETTETLPASIQRAGNGEKGYDYLVNGNYVDSGIPLDLWLSLRGENNTNILDRKGDNAKVDYAFTVITTAKNTRAVGPNCLNCHAASINNQFVIGLGAIDFDFSSDQSSNISILDFLIKNRYGQNSPEYQAFIPYRRGFQAISPLTITRTRGVNPADKYAAILAAHRNPTDLTWRENDPWGITKEIIPTDVPAWWLLKKKNAMFYTGIGTGDFARIMMASSLVSLQDSAQARSIDNRFPDVLAYIKSLTPPIYKGIIDQQKVSEGKTIYENNCSRCHGSSNIKDDYPNLLISLESIGTDPNLASTNFAYPEVLDWYNNSWFSKAPNAAKLVPKKGYVAPPLDGIWATAPYLHNGSVPTLEDLLNSSQRPNIWKRTFKSDDFDSKKVGWNYTTPSSKIDKETYDTSIKGYSNNGHVYGDNLTLSQRSALIEYLKTL